MADIPDEVQRWTAKRKAAVVMSIVKGETSAAEAVRKHGLTIAEIGGASQGASHGHSSGTPTASS